MLSSGMDKKTVLDLQEKGDLSFQECQWPYSLDNIKLNTERHKGANPDWY